jgi:hypothetical protein
MNEVFSTVLLDDRDGLNSARALILQAYYALRRAFAPDWIGCGEIAAWIKVHEPKEPMPSDALIRLTLRRHGIAHRAPGRPRNDSRVTTSPFLSARRRPSHARGG